MIQRIAWVIVIIAVLVAGAFLTLRDPGRIHRYSASGLPLAETQLEAWCSGKIFWQTQGAGNATQASECRTSQSSVTSGLDTSVNHSAVIPAFCQGAKNGGYNGSLDVGCRDYLNDRKMWPTIDGQLTKAWNDSYPYPLDVFGGGDLPPEDRGHDRPGFERSG